MSVVTSTHLCPLSFVVEKCAVDACGLCVEGFPRVQASSPRVKQKNDCAVETLVVTDVFFFPKHDKTILKYGLPWRQGFVPAVAERWLEAECGEKWL